MKLLKWQERYLNNLPNYSNKELLEEFENLVLESELDYFGRSIWCLKQTRKLLEERLEEWLKQ